MVNGKMVKKEGKGKKYDKYGKIKNKVNGKMVKYKLY